MKVRMICISVNFYPRSPCGERRIIDIINNVIDNFYPRSPCGERPSSIDDLEPSNTHFYPRSPCGERPAEHHASSQQEKFLSTLSLRRATANAVDQILPGHISIHALLAESDPLL